ncbi:MAG: MarC family protein [Corynebacteriales bacterium]|nr:MarC family protein [Mycobacteriales bacterium]
MSAFDARVFGESFVTLAVIMDPPGAIPLFLALTAGQDVRARTKAAWQAVVTSLAVIVVFALAGREILSFLGISIPALQVAGGLLLLLVALELLTGKAEAPSQTRDVNVALVPLGTPLLAGPGAIVAVIVFAQHAEDAGEFTALGAAILAIHLLLWIVLRFSVVFQRLIGQAGITIITRIAGLLLAAIAVQLVADGVRAFIDTA